MPVREFLDTEAGWTASGSFEAIFNGPHTLLELVKPVVLPGTGFSFMTALGAGVTLASLSDGGTARLAYFTATEDTRVGVGLSAGDWQLLLWTKSSEATKPRAHRLNLSTGVWTHADSTGDTIAYKTAALTEIRIGEFVHVRTAVAAVFDTALSDSDVEAIGAVRTSQLLADLGALHLWNFNQASAGTAVQDLVGTMHQTTITSGSVAVTGDDPPGWDFAVTTVPPLSFSVQLSGGGTNDDPAESFGGAMSTEQPGAGLFADVTNAQRISGLVDYRLIYVFNADVDDGSVVAYIPTQLESGRQLAIGVATQAAGVTVTKPANDQTAPAGVSFSAPSTVPSGVSLGTIPAGSFRGLWLRRTINSNTPQDPTNLATIKLEISRVS
jgi:hypothetical protein